MIDRSPFQGLKTEYYALASGTIAETHIRVAYPDDPRLKLIYGEVSGVDLGDETNQLQDKEPISYDWLVIGLGCVDSYHGIIRRSRVFLQYPNACSNACNLPEN